VKRILPPFVLTLALACVFAPLAWAATNPLSTSLRSDRSPGASVSRALTTVTGIAISPLLGTSALGAYQWMEAKGPEARAALPWYAQPKFWIPALLIVGICALKDTLGPAVPPMLKKPLDVLEVAENKVSGLVAAGAVIPFAMDAFSKVILEQSSRVGGHALGGLAMLPPLAVNWAPALDVLTIPFGIAMFAIVWMASHAINVLILLSPWGGIDAALKASRTALLGLLTFTGAFHPGVSAVLSLIVIVISYFVAGWAFRLTVFGTLLCWDFFTGRRHRFILAEDGNWVFAGSSFAGAPVRTYGRLTRRADGTLEFAFRPWLVMKPRVVAVPAPPANLAVGAGLIFSVIVREAGGSVFLLPQRYRGHEEQVVAQYGLGGGVQPAGLRKAWGSFRDLVGGRAASVPA